MISYTVYYPLIVPIRSFHIILASSIRKGTETAITKYYQYTKLQALSSDEQKLAEFENLGPRGSKRKVVKIK